MSSSEIGLYCGIITLLVAFYAGFFSRSRHKLPILLFLGFIAAYALGKDHVPFLLINKLLPSFDYIRNTEFYLAYFVFFFVMLAGLGFDRIFSTKSREIHIYIYPILLIGLLFFVYSDFIKQSFDSTGLLSGDVDPTIFIEKNLQPNTILPEVFAQNLWNFLLLSFAFLVLLVSKVKKKGLFYALLFLAFLDMSDYYLHRKELLTVEHNSLYETMENKKFSWNPTSVLYVPSENEAAPYHGAYVQKLNALMKADYHMWDFMILKDYYHFLNETDIVSYYPYSSKSFLKAGTSASDLLQVIQERAITQKGSTLPELFPGFRWDADETTLLANFNTIILDIKKRNYLLFNLKNRNWESLEIKNILPRTKLSSPDFKDLNTVLCRLVLDELYPVTPLDRLRTTVFGLYYDRLKFVTNIYSLKDPSRIYNVLTAVNNDISNPQARTNFMRNFAVVDDTRFPELIDVANVVENLSKPLPTSLGYNVLDYSSDRAVFKVTVKQKGILVFNDTFEKGWSVKVNGEKTEILRVNGIAKGVEITEPGTYIVEFNYQNILYQYTLYCYFIVFTLFLIVFPLLYYQKREILEY